MKLQELSIVLQDAEHSDRMNLATLIDCGFGPHPQALCDHFRWVFCGLFGQLWDNRDYKDLVTAVADHEQIDWPSLLQGRTWHQLTPQEIEDAVVITVARRIYDIMPESDRSHVADELHKFMTPEDFSNLLISGSLMAAVQSSGFGIFLLSSISIHAISGALGTVLPFSFYTTESQAMAVVLGPIGWSFLATAAFLRLNETKWEKLLIGVIYVSHIRHKQQGR